MLHRKRWMRSIQKARLSFSTSGSQLQQRSCLHIVPPLNLHSQFPSYVQYVTKNPPNGDQVPTTLLTVQLNASESQTYCLDVVVGSVADAAVVQYVTSRSGGCEASRKLCFLLCRLLDSAAIHRERSSLLRLPAGDTSLIHSNLAI